MDTLEIFRTAASTLQGGQEIALVTVVSTTGSSPGKTGYKMLVVAGGRRVAGTVGGGLVEAEMIAQAASMLSKPCSRTFRFNLGERPDDEKGICGGAVELLIETFDDSAVPLFNDLVAATESDRPGVLVSIITPDGLPRKILLPDVREVTAGADDAFAPEIHRAIEQVAAAGQGGMKVSAAGVDAFIESIAQSPTVVIFGAGHLSCHVARYAAMVHLRVTVYDDRDEYANRQRFPDADEIIVADFRQVLDAVRIDERSYVVIVTRGHQFDTLVLEQVLQTNARYIGMIGSRRKTLTILRQLRDKGVSQESLERVFSPIGLSVGAVTPEEIALSIVCELVKIRRVGCEPHVGHMAISRSGGDA